jgi:hypothetical protein
MRTLKKIMLWLGLIVVWSNLLFINIGTGVFSAVSGLEFWPWVLGAFDIGVLYLTCKYMGWLPTHYECTECGCSMFDETETSLRCTRCGKPMRDE